MKMSFIQRELEHIRRLLGTRPNGPEYDRLYAAQQALAWAQEPTGFAPPSVMITGEAAPLDPSPAAPLSE